ncbi:MAG: hypothetical protein ACLU38_15215 [Dysosmobacter sp.]
MCLLDVFNAFLIFSGNNCGTLREVTAPGFSGSSGCLHRNGAVAGGRAVVLTISCWCGRRSCTCGGVKKARFTAAQLKPSACLSQLPSWATHHSLPTAGCLRPPHRGPAGHHRHGGGSSPS